MYVKNIELRNWARYAGTVTADLGPEIYAVEARWEGDADRSNWGGKSKLVEAIPFALYGWHRDARQGAGADDLVITHGEPEGGVLIRLSTGHVIERVKPRGKPARLKVYVPGRETPAIGEAAQKEVDRLIGLSKDDFFSTCFVRQKEISRFVTGNAGERQELIADWCQLRPLERAAKRASDALADAIRRREKAAARVAALTEMAGRYLPGTYGGETVTTVEELVAVSDRLREQVAERQRALDVLRRRREAGIAWDAKADSLAAQEALGEEVEKAREEARAARAAVPLMPDLTPLFSAHQAAAADLRTKSALAVGGFDGTCPVGGCECPIAEQLNADRERNARARDEAQAVERAAKAALSEGQGTLTAVREAELRAERAEARLRTLEGQAARASATQALGERPAEVSPLEMQAVERQLQEARGEQLRADEAHRQLLAVQRDVGAAEREVEQLAREVAELRGAAVILGRSGAQRMIGQGMVSAVERAANAEMSAAGIGLVVRVPWEREGGKLAPECEACGQPIRGEAAKSCPRCEAPRGKAVVQGPFVSLSDRSGAAEDLVGMALQLAVTSWLRRRRDVAWSSVVLDEPLGALDRTNRAAVSAHLVSMLRGRHGFTQAFVIAHETGVLDAMPARIIVRAGQRSSTLEVM